MKKLISILLITLLVGGCFETYERIGVLTIPNISQRDAYKATKKAVRSAYGKHHGFMNVSSPYRIAVDDAETGYMEFSNNTLSVKIMVEKDNKNKRNAIITFDGDLGNMMSDQIMESLKEKGFDVIKIN